MNTNGESENGEYIEGFFRADSNYSVIFPIWSVSR